MFKDDWKKRNRLVFFSILTITYIVINNVLKSGMDCASVSAIWWIFLLCIFSCTVKKRMNMSGKSGQIIFGLLISLFQIAYINIQKNGSLNWFYEYKYVLGTSIIICLIALCSILASVELEKIISCSINRPRKQLGIFGKRPYIETVLVMIIWLPFLICVYPGSYGWDTMFQLRQYNGIVPYSTSTPFLLTQLYGVIFSTFRNVFGTNQLGMYGIYIFQYVGMAIAIGHSIRTLNKMGLHEILKVIIFLSYVCIPVFPAFVAFCNKDTPFCIAFMFAISYAMRICSDEKNIHLPGNLVGMGLSLLFVTTFRLNGPMASSSLGFMVICYILSKYKKIYLKNAIIIAAIPILGCLCINVVSNNIAGLSTNGKKISAASLTVKSLAYLQTANYVREYPNDVSAEERNVLENMWNYDELAGYYSDSCVDLVRNSRICDDEEYWKIWLSMGRKHPGAYVKATMMMTGKYLYLFEPVDNYVGFTMDDSEDGILDGINILSKETYERREKFVSWYTRLVYETPIKYISTTAIYIYLVISMTILMRIKKKKVFLIVAIPLIVMTISALLSPAASTRYALPVICGAPMMFSFCRWECKKQ